MHKIFAAIMTLMIVATVVAGFPRFVFFPTVEGDNVVVSLTMPQGTPITKTTEALARIEQAAVDLCAELDVEQPSEGCLLYTSPSPRDGLLSRMPSSA